MRKGTDSFWGAAIYHQALSRWAKSVRDAGTMRIGALRAQRTRARQLRTHLDRFIHAADERLSNPTGQLNTTPSVYNSDWTWRPSLWRARLAVPGLSALAQKAPLGDDLSFHHDCTRSEITVRQLRNALPSDQAPYGLQIDICHFHGSFFSMAIDIPNPIGSDLKRTQVVGLQCQINAERPLRIFARLNLRHGPNAEQITREVDQSGPEAEVAFDLAFAKLHEARLEKAWIDLIFEHPQMNQLILRDMVLFRHPRAQL
ncbi:DUF6478 family protein [Roseobacter sp.]|uniref:DUF6478 family protein n=1 Tax=Roseobacter sp. TaxID=1907202 RepID=UPI003297C060